MHTFTGTQKEVTSKRKRVEKGRELKKEAFEINMSGETEINYCVE
jgi:hypothetical protein